MIHYHGADFNGSDQPVLALQAKHAMVSFARSAQLPELAELCQSFCIDNGAFTAWKSGQEYDFDGYAEFIEKWARHPACDFWLIPDKIDGTEEENLQLVSQYFDLAPGGVPVWHLHESLDWLNDLCNSHDRVAIGSSGQFAEIGTQSWWQRMAEAMKACCDHKGYPIAKLHGLRMLDPTIFSHFPFSSADSTNVARNIGIDNAWSGPYAPKSRRMRALIMMERIEAHAAASRWAGTMGVQQNLELFG